MKQMIRIEEKSSNNYQQVLMDEMETARRWVSKSVSLNEREIENANVMVIAIANIEATLETTHRIAKEINSIIRIEIETVIGVKGLESSGIGTIETLTLTIDAALMANREGDLLNNE